MSRLIALTADELLSSSKSSVMGAYYGTDDEVDGLVVLGSANGFPNPDLTDLDERGRLRAWNLDAATAPDSWDVLMKRLTRIDASGQHVLLSDGVPILRQNESLLKWGQHTYQQDHPLIVGRSLTDLGADEITDLAPVLDAPRVEVITIAGNTGYPAGPLWFSYFGIIGKNPATSRRITNSAPAIQLASPDIAQGQVILFYLPDEIPNSWTGVGFSAGPSATTMKAQKRVDIRGRVLTETVDHGPYRRDGMLVSAAGVNRSYMGSYQEYAEPIVWRTNSNLNLRSGNYALSYSLKTPQGWTASQKVANVSVANDHEGEVLMWSPPKAVLQREDIVGWRPEFRGSDGHFYTFEEAGGNGYPLRRGARLHTKKTGKDDWKSANGPVKINREEKDRSGVAGPTDPMETPLAQGASAMAPGRYAVRVNTASEKEDMRSRPSPRTVVTLRDAGLAAGGAASGVTDQMIRVFRPAGQSIKNSRLMEFDPVTGTQDLHWERFTVTGISVTTADGFITVADTSLDTSNLFTVYRRSSAEPVDPTRFYVVRTRMDVTRRVSGSARISLRFLNAAKAFVSTVTLEDFRSVADSTVKYTIGPAGGSAQFDIPANAAYVQVFIAGIGATGDARNFDFSVSNMGLFVGKTTPRKLYDLVLAEDTPGRDAWPVPDTEDPALHYPAGPYCRHVLSPTDPAKVRIAPVDNKGFEDNSATSGSWTVVTTTGGTFAVSATYALRSLYGARSDVGATSPVTWGAYIWKDYWSSTRSTFGVEGTFRLKTLPSAGTAAILGVTRDTNLGNYLARVQIDSTGLISLMSWDGTSVTALSTGITAQAGDDLRCELVFSGLRTAAGSVSLLIKRNDRPVVATTRSGLTWTAGNPGGNVYRVIAGYQFGSTATATGRVLLDRIRTTNSGVNESTNIPGGMVEYWAPERQPFADAAHFMTGPRYPVDANTTYVDSVYVAYDGVTTPTDGADLFKLVSYDSKDRPLADHGYIMNAILGRDYWDRYFLSYTTPAGAAYVRVERNRVGDGLIRAMGFQHQTGTTPTAFVNTNAMSGTFSVVFKTTVTGGPKDGDTAFTTALRRIRDVSTHQFDANGNQVTTVTWRARAAATEAGLASAPWVTSASLISPAYEYLEVEVTLTTTDATRSPEVRAVFADVTRDRPVLLTEDGRDFYGGAIVYQLTPASPAPNMVRKEYADGSTGQEYVGRSSSVPKKLKLSVQAFEEEGKEQVEANPATERPRYRVEVPHLGKVYVIEMSGTELSGSSELAPDGTQYFDYTAEGLEADVVIEEDL